MGTQNDLVSLVARFLLGLVFFIAGVGKIMGYAGTVQYATNAGLPMPDIAVPLGIVAEIGLPLLLLVGFQTRLAALGLIVFTLVASWFFHDFWTMEGQARTLNQILLLKNLALVGGLMLLAAAGPGRYSLDGRPRRRR